MIICIRERGCPRFEDHQKLPGRQRHSEMAKPASGLQAQRSLGTGGGGGGGASGSCRTDLIGGYVSVEDPGRAARQLSRHAVAANASSRPPALSEDLGSLPLPRLHLLIRYCLGSCQCSLRSCHAAQAFSVNLAVHTSWTTAAAQDACRCSCFRPLSASSSS